jgi:hypothetical protein
VAALQKLGCLVERAHMPELIGVDVPPGAPLSPVTAYLHRMKIAGVLEHEEACVQHETRPTE